MYIKSRDVIAGRYFAGVLVWTGGDAGDDLQGTGSRIGRSEFRTFRGSDVQRFRRSDDQRFGRSEVLMFRRSDVQMFRREYFVQCIGRFVLCP